MIEESWDSPCWEIQDDQSNKHPSIQLVGSFSFEKMSGSVVGLKNMGYDDYYLNKLGTMPIMDALFD